MKNDDADQEQHHKDDVDDDQDENDDVERMIHCRLNYIHDDKIAVFQYLVKTQKRMNKDK